MAIQSFQLDPAAGGVSQSEFDNHTHKYRKLMTLGVDASKQFSSPVRSDLVDNSEIFVIDGTDLEAVALTVATEESEIPT